MYSISTLINTSNGNVPKRMHMLRDTYNGQRFSLTIIKPSIHFLNTYLETSYKSKLLDIDASSTYPSYILSSMSLFRLTFFSELDMR